MSADDLTTFKKLLDNAYNYEEALKRQNLKQEDVDKLREKIKYSQHVPDFITDKQLLLFLNAFKNDIDKSGKMLENFCRLKKATPEFFASRDLDSKEIQAALDHQDYVDLPVTPDNCNLIFHRLSSFEPQHYVFDEAVKTFIMTSEAYAYHHGPRSGTIFVFDLRGVRFGHLFRPGVNSVRKGIRFLEDGSPFDIKAVHIINTVPFFDMIVGIVKPFIRSQLLNKIKFHPSNMDWEKFYSECIPKSHLPSDFGGDLASVEELHKLHRIKLMGLRDYFVMEEQQMNRTFDQYTDEFCDDAKK